LGGFGEPLRLADYGMKSESKRFPTERTFVWGSSPCGDVLIYTDEGEAGFLSHETSTAYSLGTIEEAINWVFNGFLQRHTPEFDYARA
jgi:hypothetical protein